MSLKNISNDAAGWLQDIYAAAGRNPEGIKAAMDHASESYENNSDHIDDPLTITAERNKLDAEIFLDEWSKGARGNKLPLVGSYGWRNVHKAAAIASGSLPLDVLGGNKVRAFYTCIADPSNCIDVCIDRHAKCAAYGKYLGDTVVTNAEYPIIARHYLRAASRASLLPCQYQAIVWVTWRRLRGQLAQEDLF